MHKILMRVIGLTAVCILFYVWLGFFSSAAQLANILEQFLPGSGRPALIVLSIILFLMGLIPIVFGGFKYEVQHGLRTVETLGMEF